MPSPDIKRIYNGKELDAAVNHPSVLHLVAPGFESFIFDAFTKDARHVALKGGGGVCLFVHVGGGVFDGHYLFPKRRRGSNALKFCKLMLDEMFTKHQAHAIVGQIPLDNMASRIMTRRLGFAPTFKSRDTLGRQCANYKLGR